MRSGASSSIAATALLAGLLLAACADPAAVRATAPDTSREATMTEPLDRIHDAAARTVGAGTVRFTMTMRQRDSDFAATTSERGAFDFAARRGWVEVTTRTSWSRGPDSTDTERTLFIDDTTYRHGEGLPKPWMKSELPWGKGCGHSGAAVQFDPTGTLVYLQRATMAATAGREEVRGVAATRYRVTADLFKGVDMKPADPRAREQARRRMLDAMDSPEMPPEARRGMERAFEELDRQGFTPPPPELVEVWLDDQGRLRRLRKSHSYPAWSEPDGGADHGPETVATTVELYGFGGPVHVTPPPADEVGEWPTAGEGIWDVTEGTGGFSEIYEIHGSDDCPEHGAGK